jgi:hypothetical protein
LLPRLVSHRALAALRADSDLSSGLIFAVRAFKPSRLPSSTATEFFLCFATILPWAVGQAKFTARQRMPDADVPATQRGS